MKLISRLCLLGMVCLHVAFDVPSARAQTGAPGSLFGQVTEAETARELTNVVVRVMGSGLQVRSGSDGRYAILGLESGSYDVEFALAGYNLQTLRGVPVRPGEATRLDVTLALELFELPLLEVMADPLEDFDQALLLDRMQSSVSFDGLSSERMAQIGVGDAAEALAKVPGASLVGGKFAVVRGLSDRYTIATLNGGEIPSADPNRKAAQLDLFPSEMIDTVTVFKTFTPDQPGGFTGGAVNIKTKPFPEKFLFKTSVGTSYNTQSSLRSDYYSYTGGGLDWLGIDDGFRELPSIVDSAGPNGIPSPIGNTQEKDLLAEMNRSFQGYDMAPRETDSPLNFDFSMSTGDTIQVADRDLGYFVGINYSSEYSFYDDGINARWEPSGVNTLRKVQDLQDTRGVYEVDWGTIASLAYRLSDGHEVDFLFMNVHSADDEARRQVGPDTLSLLDTSTLHWTERNLSAFQLSGRHEFPDLLGWKAHWLASVSETEQDEPDLRFFAFYTFPFPDGSGEYYEFNNNFSPSLPSRYFRNLNENNLNVKLDNSIPFSVLQDKEGEFKFGGNYSASERTFTERSLRYNSQNGFQPFFSEGDPNTFLTYENLGYESGVFPRYIENVPSNYRYNGEQEILAFYGMIDTPVWSIVRLTAGVRYEMTDLSVVTTGGELPMPESAEIDQGDLLPAVALILGLKENLNLRFSYSETLARPTYREISAVPVFDYVGGDRIIGNPDLEMSSIQNFDVRAEWFPQPGEVLAASIFYKDIQQPIEQVIQSLGGDITYENKEQALVYGAEVEARRNLGFVDDSLSSLTLGVNFAWIISEVELTPVELQIKQNGFPDTDPERPLFDQSPYVGNADLTYSLEHTGTTATLAYSIFGRRLSIVSYDRPDIYEESFSSLDFILSQRLSQRWSLKFSAKNLLNEQVLRVYDFEMDGEKPVYSSYRKGTKFGLSLSYTF